ncbi:MAG: hypothetical protein ACUBOA_02645 [Candidatus Loosdrechtia sp.]|nr:MAG: hypothetical protein QY305_02040 [Candidatus Jettenia sp. AMX2]
MTTGTGILPESVFMAGQLSPADSMILPFHASTALNEAGKYKG